MGFPDLRSKAYHIAADVRFGSLADIAGRSRHVRFTPNSGHHSDITECPLCAKSGNENAVSSQPIF